MRQRTVSDFFWRDPEICDLSQEDKATLLYLLTSPSSNIIGVYQVVPRIAAAEMGWTTDQLMVVLGRLRVKGLIAFSDCGWIWIKIWWKHNSARGSFSGTLKKVSNEQIAEIPFEWRDEFLQLLELAGVDRVSIGYQYPIDTPPPNTNTNTNCNTTTTTNQNQNQNQKQVVVVVDDIDDLVEAAVWAAAKGGVPLRNEPGFRFKKKARLFADGPSAEDRQSLSAWREAGKRSAQQAELACKQIEDRKKPPVLDKELCAKGAGFFKRSGGVQEKIKLAGAITRCPP